MIFETFEKFGSEKPEMNLILVEKLIEDHDELIIFAMNFLKKINVSDAESQAEKIIDSLTDRFMQDKKITATIDDPTQFIKHAIKFAGLELPTI